MARDIYYQPVNNPLRHERLPKRRPKMALPVRSGRPVRLAVHKRLTFYYLAVLLAALAMVWLQPPLGSFVVLAACVFYFGHHAVEKRDYRGFALAWPFPLAVILATVGAVSPALLHMAASTALGWLSWMFGRNWTAYCTASPYPRAEAEAVRRHAAKHIVVFSLLIPAAGILTALAAQPVLFVLPIGAAVATQLVLTIHGGNGRRVFSVAHQAIASWLTYDPSESRSPGILSSPAGPWRFRVALTAACLLLTSVALREPLSPSVPVAQSLKALPNAAARSVEISPIVVGLLLPIMATLILPVSLTLSILSAVARPIPRRLRGRAWTDLIDDIQRSTDPIERRSIYRGRNAADGSPVLIPSKIFTEHAHFLGDSGGGKTSLGLMPTLEQLLARGDCSVIAVDLKADSLELLATLQAAAAVAQRRYGVKIPVKRFTNQTGLGTYSFNPLMQPYWRNFDLYMRTDILCGALGLTYGTDYGRGYYSSANAAVLYHTLKNYPEASTFRELADAIGCIVANAKKHELHTEIRKAGVHVQEVIKRLAASDAMNVDRPTDDLPFAINPADVFTKPQALYLRLSSSLAPGSSPEIARLFIYLLLCAANRVERRHPVYLFIDEFQRMVASNVEYTLQMARSMGVGIILANQSLQDLKTSTSDPIPAVEANCRYREWFSVSSSDDRKHLVESSGETIQLFSSFTKTTGDRTSTSVSRQERTVPRLTTNDILLATDHPMKSVVKITRGDGYAQYGGMPFIVEHEFHITAEEYENRKAFRWPEPDEGMLVADSRDPDDANGPPSGPYPGSPPPQSPRPPVTTEVVGDDVRDDASPDTR